MRKLLHLPLAIALGAFALVAPVTSAQQEEKKTPTDKVPRPPAPKPVPSAELEASIQKGRAFLFQKQNENGSWGSSTRTKGLNIYAPVPAAHHSFRAGSTSLALAGLLATNPEKKKDLPSVEANAIAKAEAWMLEELPKLRRNSNDALYNIWGHAYGIIALCEMHRRPGVSEERKKKIEVVMKDQLDRLVRYELVNGGWGYYDFVAQTAKPSGSPTSFTTATVLHALHEMEKLTGIEAPDKITERALESIRRQFNPDHTYAYGEYLKMRPRASINRPGGSLGRTLACNAVLLIHEDERVDQGDIKDALDRLFARNLWLDIGRKRPIPHESYFGVAGYFFYYGHYYGAVCIDLAPEKERAPARDHLANILIPLQEQDGSWWDYPLYDYGQSYGTGYALLSLERCRQPKKK